MVLTKVNTIEEERQKGRESGKITGLTMVKALTMVNTIG